MEADYRAKTVSLILELLVENDWPHTAVPLQEAVTMLSMLPTPVVTQTLISLTDRSSVADTNRVSVCIPVAYLPTVDPRS